MDKTQKRPPSSDMDGIRKSKTVGTEQHTYLTQSGKVMRETIGSGSTAKILDFVYDDKDQPFAMCYSNNNGTSFTTFYYILNMQGDVVRLVNAYGQTKASYEYDAWGNILSQQSYDNNFPYLHLLNPIRYRGYYYDRDTGWYYLQSRYYDPEVGRFINADLPEYSAAFSIDDNSSIRLQNRRGTRARSLRCSMYHPRRRYYCSRRRSGTR